MKPFTPFLSVSLVVAAMLPSACAGPALLSGIACRGGECEVEVPEAAAPAPARPAPARPAPRAAPAAAPAPGRAPFASPRASVPKKTRAAPAPSRPRAAAPATPASARPAAGSEIAALEATERSLWERYDGLQTVRKSVVRLTTALALHRDGPTAETECRARETHETYREAAVKHRLVPVLAALTLSACSSVDAQIADLNREERRLYDEIQALQEQRKRCVGLIVALEQSRRDDDASSRVAVAKAREAYDSVRR